jgi:hypothetical protein
VSALVGDHPLSPADRDEHPLAALRELVLSARVDGASERCSMCAAPVPNDHPHLVDTVDRTIRCACRACHLLFSEPGAANGRYRQIPGRYRRVAGLDITEREWSELQVPVSLAFFFRHSGLDRVVAFYPGPAGATESLLPLDAWTRLSARHAELTDLEDDVEAVIVRLTAEDTEAFVVPIDRCYALTGRLRMTWTGFDGGAEAHAEIDCFFDELRERTGA